VVHGQPGIQHRLGELSIFGQEAVARMHRVRARVHRRPQHLDHVPIGFCGRRAGQGHGLVRRPHVHGVAVWAREHRHTGQAGGTAGPGDPDRDLTPVGDQHLVHAVTSVTEA
jgi:hypothetical protein